MKNPYNAILDKIETETEIGYAGQDFLLDMHTVRINTKFRHMAWIHLIKVSDYIEDEPFISMLEQQAKEEVARKVWRLNDKRVRHGLESWI